MTVTISVIIGIALVLLIGYLFIFHLDDIFTWICKHLLAAFFIGIVVVPMAIVAIFLLLGLIL